MSLNIRFGRGPKRMAKLELPQDPILAAKVVDLEARKHERWQKGGWMSTMFGFSTEKPGNIAAFVLLVSFVLFGCVLMWGVDAPSISKKDELSMIGGFIALALGFVFGRSTS
jgi:hypothetical protein